MRYLLAAFPCLLLGACQSLTDVSILPGAYGALTKQIEVAPAFFQNVATAYAKTNDEYKFLTNRSCSELGTRSIRAFNALKLVRVVRGKKQTLTYSEYEAERFNIQTKSFKFLADFAAQMDARAKAAEEFAKGTGYFVTGAEIAASIPVVGVQATAYAAATKAVVGVLNSAVAGATVEELVRIAQKVEPDLATIVKQVKTDFGVINVDADVYLGAWQDCQLAKLNRMRNGIPSLTPSSPIELDAAYSAYLQQAADYRKAVPTVDDELDAIVKANTKIAKRDFDSAVTAAQELVAAANAAYSAYQMVQKLP
jgi:hypothetical protein